MCMNLFIQTYRNTYLQLWQKRLYNKLQYLLGFDTVIILWGHNFQATKVVQDPDIGNVEFGKEPVMISRPAFHLRVSSE